MIRDLMICLSFANMFFARAWMRVLGPDHAYYMPHADGEAAFVGASVIFAAAVGFGLIRWIRKYRPTALQSKGFAAFLGSLIIVVAVPSASVLTLISILFLLAAVALDRFSIPVIVARLSLVALPCALVTFGQAFWLIAEPKLPHAKVEAAHPASPHRRGSPVVWIIFDELDQEVAFDRRPASVVLPALDDFKAHAWSAANALPPANYTEISIPALTTGRSVADTRPSSSRDMMIRFTDSNRYVPWSKQDSVFSQALAQGFDVSIVGWYHPYCEVFQGQFSYCFQHKTDLVYLPIVRNSFRASLKEELQETVPVVELAYKFEDENKTERNFHAKDFESVDGALQTALARFNGGILYLHLPIPHPPGFYDSKTGTFTTDESANYLENLFLVDQTLSKIKLTLQSREMWDDSSVIVSSDHWWRVRLWSKGPQWTRMEEEFDRKSDHRIPFMVKLPHQTEPAVYPSAFNTVVSSKLVLSMLEGKLKSSEDLSSKVRSETQAVEPVFRPYR